MLELLNQLDGFEATQSIKVISYHHRVCNNCVKPLASMVMADWLTQLTWLVIRNKIVLSG